MNDINEKKRWFGLSSYTEDDSHLFFGRNRNIKELLSHIKGEPLTVFHGRSGLGKTSLLHAGLSKECQFHGYFPVIYNFRKYDNHEKSITECIIEEIKQKAQKYHLLFDWDFTYSNLWEFFHTKDKVFKNQENRIIEPLIIIDQFEEIFRQIERGDVEEEIRQIRIRKINQFINELADLIHNNTPVNTVKKPEDKHNFDLDQNIFKILLSLRSDYIPELDGLKDKIPSIPFNQYMLSKMDKLQAMEVVLKPGVGIVNREVAESIIEFILEKSDSSSSSLIINQSDIEIDPALLSVVCTKLNEKRIDNNFDMISLDLLEGSKETIIKDFYEDNIKDLEPNVSIFIEESLLTPSGRRQSVSSESAKTKDPNNPNKPFIHSDQIDKLVDKFLLNQEERRGTKYIELSHDVLSDVIIERRDQRHIKEQKEIAKAKTRATLFWASLTGLFALLFVISVFFSWWALSLNTKNKNNLAAYYNREGHRARENQEWGKALSFYQKSMEQVDTLETRLGAAEAMRYFTPQIISFNDSAKPIACFDANGKYFAYDTMKNKIFIRSATSWDIISTPPYAPDASINCIAFHPQKNILAVGYKNNGIKFWDFTNEEYIEDTKFNIDNEQLSSFIFTPDGSKIIATTNAYTYCWDTSDSSEQIRYNVHNDINDSSIISYNPNLNSFITVNDSGVVFLLSLDRQNATAFLSQSQTPIHSILYNSNFEYFTFLTENTVNRIHRNDENTLQEFKLDYIQDPQKLFLYYSDDNTLKMAMENGIAKLENGSFIPEIVINNPSSPFDYIREVPNQDLLVAISHDGKLQIYTKKPNSIFAVNFFMDDMIFDEFNQTFFGLVKSGTSTKIYRSNLNKDDNEKGPIKNFDNSNYSDLVLIDDLNQIIGVTNDNQLILYDIETQKERIINDFQNEIFHFAHQSKNNILIVVTFDMTISRSVIWIYDLNTENEINHSYFNFLIESIKISPEDNIIALGTPNKHIEIVEWDSKEIKTIDYINGYNPHTFSFNHNGDYFAASDGKRIRQWKTDTWQPYSIFTGNFDTVDYPAYSHDGKFLIASTKKKDSSSITFWNVNTQKQISSLSHIHEAVEIKTTHMGKGDKYTVITKSTTSKINEKPLYVLHEIPLYDFTKFKKTINTLVLFGFPWELDKNDILNNRYLSETRCNYLDQNEIHWLGFKKEAFLPHYKKQYNDEIEKKYLIKLYDAIVLGEKSTVLSQLKNIKDKNDIIFGDNYTPLGLSIKNGEVDITDLLLDEGAHINKPCYLDQSPLILATIKKDDYIFDTLLQKGAEIGSAFNYFLEKRDINAINFLLSKDLDFQSINVNDEPLLIATSKINDLNILSMIAEKYNSVDIRDKNDATPLMHAIKVANSTQCISYLIEKKANINAYDTKNNDIFYYSSLAGNKFVVEYLLKQNKIDLSKKNPNTGETSLFSAIRGGNTDIVDLLIANGASLEAIRNDGYSPIYAAKTPEMYDYLKTKITQIPLKENNLSPFLYAVSIGNLPIVKHLASSNIWEKTKEGNYAFHIAAINGQNEIYDYLCETDKYWMNQTNNFKETPLMLAIKSNHDIDFINEIIELGSDINAIDTQGFTPLILSASNNNLNTVNSLLDNGALIDPIRENSSITSALGMASRNNNKQMLDVLIKRNANINAEGEYWPSALIVAASHGHTELVSYLIENGAVFEKKGTNADSTTKNIRPLSVAAMNGHLDIVKILLDQGADIEANTNYSPSALLSAAETGQLEVVRYLIKNGTDINKISWGYYISSKWERYNAINIAASFGQKEIIQELIKNKVDPNQLGPILYSAMYGHLDTLTLLIENNADLSYKQSISNEQYTFNNSNVLHIAARCGHLDMVKYLIDKKMDIHELDDDQYSPLLHAIAGGHENIVIYLTDLDGGIEKSIAKNNLLILTAAKHGQTQIYDYLKSNGADIHIVDSDGKTALMYAAIINNIEIAQDLLNEGLKVDNQDNKGLTSLHYAVHENNLEIASFLLKNKANINIQDNEGLGAIHYAVNTYRHDDVKMLTFLLNNEANTKLKTKRNKTPLILAIEKADFYNIHTLLNSNFDLDINAIDNDGFSAIAYCAMENVFYIDDLLNKGADIKFKTQDGFNLIILSVLYNDASGSLKEYFVDGLKTIMNCGISIDSKDNKGWTGIFHASVNGSVDKLGILVDLGADINCKDKEGKTALMHAVLHNKKESIDFLISKGAKLNLQDKEGKTALIYAVINELDQIIEPLIGDKANYDLKDKKGHTAYDHSKLIKDRINKHKVMLILELWLDDYLANLKKEQNHNNKK
jgi:serine/threonine-protein phosphatase 6 regulatory ankyrin repeat subunit B